MRPGPTVSGCEGSIWAERPRVALSYDVAPDLASATGTDNVVEGAAMCTG